ncbi:MAG: ATP-binding cassette domain-containing protein, partial [bacterium]
MSLESTEQVDTFQARREIDRLIVHPTFVPPTPATEHPTMPTDQPKQPASADPAAAPAGGLMAGATQPPAAGLLYPRTEPTDFLECVRLGHPYPPAVHAALGREKPLLEVPDCSVFSGQARALYSLYRSIPNKKVTALIGPSGCGKSTLLRSINRLNDLIDSVSVTGDMLLSGRSVYAPNVD